MPKVSVIIPNYNHARFLTKRIESVLGQTYEDMEILLLDDLSTDNSRDIIQHYGDDKRVQVVLNDQNGGSPFKQWNKGARLACGEYLWIAESDDFADLHFLEKMVPVLDRNPNVGIVMCQSYTVDEDDRVCELIESRPVKGRDWTSDFILRGQEECRLQLTHGISIYNASGTLVRKSTYLKAGMAEESFKLSGDWYTWCKILMVSDFAFLAQPLNYFRQAHAETARAKFMHSTNGIKNVEDLRVIKYLLSELPDTREQRKVCAHARAITWACNVDDPQGGKIPLHRSVRILWMLFTIKQTAVLVAGYSLLRKIAKRVALGLGMQRVVTSGKRSEQGR